MSDPGWEARARAEIEALHRFFVGWFTGALSESVFEADFLSRFDAQFRLVQPGGVMREIEDFQQGLRAAHGNNPAFRIAIRHVQVQRVFDDHLLVTYEEWQRHARASKPPDNARLATVLFRVEGEALRWLHVHETWLPVATTAAGPYDF